VTAADYTMTKDFLQLQSRQRLRSATSGDLVISPTVMHFGARSFAVAGPKAWNQLPTDIRATDSVNSSKDIFVPLTICINQTRRALVIVLPCYGALEIVGVIFIIIRYYQTISRKLQFVVLMLPHQLCNNNNHDNSS